MVLIWSTPVVCRWTKCSMVWEPIWSCHRTFPPVWEKPSNRRPHCGSCLLGWRLQSGQADHHLPTPRPQPESWSEKPNCLMSFCRILCQISFITSTSSMKWPLLQVILIKCNPKLTFFMPLPSLTGLASCISGTAMSASSSLGLFLFSSVSTVVSSASVSSLPKHTYQQCKYTFDSMG